ncbi:ROK family protein [Pacificoceanicola onchidii]|uniref:ROK family protein n=1 Tax=Pacificoceanicola onchidii TaxID=2562685 RepID=UPI0010A6B3C8|nr:ROK family protein [Pacificoceanicola onchidii]
MQNLSGDIDAIVEGCGPLHAPTEDTVRPLRQQVFEHVRARGQVPRVAVAKDLAVSPASVTTITSELIESGFLEEVQSRKQGETGRGRPAVALRVRPGARHVMGLKLADRRNTAVIADLSGQVIASAAAPRELQALTLEQLLDDVDALMHKVCAEAGLTPADLSGLGLGIPGFIDGTSRRMLWSPVLQARDADITGPLEQRLGIPVQIDNDANLLTLAELWFGVGRTIPNFAVVTIEQGVGMGLVINQRLYRGARGMGMELGHSKVHLDGALCRCGQRGCLEAYVADYALVREARTALNLPDVEGPSVSSLLEALLGQAKSGNPAAHSIFRRAGRYLALALANVANLFDPQLIILAGERMSYDYLYANETLREMKTMALDTGRAPPRVEIHAWGDMVWARGAAALALDHLTESMLGHAREMAAQ